MKELPAEFYNLSAFLVLWRGKDTVLCTTSVTLLIPYIFSTFIQALGRKLNEYWDAKTGHSNEVQIQ